MTVWKSQGSWILGMTAAKIPLASFLSVYRPIASGRKLTCPHMTFASHK